VAGTIYSGTYVNGIVLGNPATQNPAAITATGKVSRTGVALLGEAGTAWTVSNSGTIEGIGTASDGIYLRAGGRLTNNPSGLISGSVNGVAVGNATGTVVNSGKIEGTGTASGGIYLIDGGSIANRSGGLITGGIRGITVGHSAGNVANLGTITGTGTSGGGIWLIAGGSLSNGASGSTAALIDGRGTAVTIGSTAAGRGTVANFGIIKSTTGDGAFLAAGGTVKNFGTIKAIGTGGTGVFLAGGSVTNGSSTSPKALIAGGDGVFVTVATGAVTNYGTISGPIGSGIDLQSGGTIINGSSASATALIGGGDGVFVTGATGAVTNFGTIKAATGEGVFLVAGGIVRNFGTIESAGTAYYGVVDKKGAVINGSSASTKALIEGVGGVFLNGTATTGAVANFGTIKATTGRGVMLDGGGTVSNFGTIESARLGVGIRSAVGTISNFGTIISTNTTTGGAVWSAKGGVVTNGASGSSAALITAERFAVYIGGNSGTHYVGAVGTVTNFGTIETSGSYSAVLLVAGGTVRNFGVIDGYRGIHIESAAGILTNNGVVRSLATGGTASRGVELDAGGTVGNLGTINSSAGDGVFLAAGGHVNNGVSSKPSALIKGGVDGAVMEGAAATITNFGTIEGSLTASPVSTLGVALAAGGTVANHGLIAGGSYGIGFGTTASAGTVVNSGTITGKVGFAVGAGNTAGNALANSGRIVGTGGRAVVFGGGDDVLTVDPGAVFVGAVEGGGGANKVIEGTHGLLNVAGFSGFETILLANGGTDTLALSNANFAGVTASSITIDGGNAGNSVNAAGLTGTKRIVAVGGAGKDSFTGGAGNDFFYFRDANLAATDVVKGGGGSDTLVVTTAGIVHAAGVNGVETYRLGNGATDTLALTNSNFVKVSGLSVSPGAVPTITVFGGNAGNWVSAAGVAAGDRLVVHGGAGIDTLTGGAGGDVFYADGKATMTGGAGANEFVFTATGADKITDFHVSAKNELVFSSSGFNLGLGGGSATPRELTTAQATELFVANTTGKFANAGQRLAYDKSSGQLFAGAHGSAGSEQLVATLSDHAAIAATQLFYIR
jgi:Ca2+-binding RTX toxin-like protein